MEKRMAATQIFQQQEVAKQEEQFGEQEAGPVAEPGALAQQALSSDEINGLLQAANADKAPQIVPSQPRKSRRHISFSNLKTSEELQLEKDPAQIKETGAWFWRRIIVPPNAYVVQTRINRVEPVTIGLGKSFRYRPKTDAFLVVPAALQTIGVVANCITREKQGINVLAYLQWQIDDFAQAFKRLDFSDRTDPVSIVNAQLREQAEAAIKDKIATMSVEEVLTDKAPIIEELTSRLREVTEGRLLASSEDRSEESGLGIRITTVQIREAIVSSETLWRDLQSPYRHEQQKKSRISHLDAIGEVKKKELDSSKSMEAEQAEALTEIEKIKQNKQTEQRLHALQEEEKRAVAKHDVRLREIELASKLRERETELGLMEKRHKAQIDDAELTASLQAQKKELDARLASEEEQQRIQHTVDENRLKLSRIKQEIRNLTNDQDVMVRLIRAMPQIVSELPEISEMKVVKTDDH